MIKLRLVGSSADLANLIYTSQNKGRKGSHMAPIDDKLYDVLEDVYRKKKRQQKADQAVKKAAEPRIESKLAPREIQKLLRAGRSPEQVAKLAAVPVAFVERFRRPVLDEQLGIIQEFQTLRFTKPRLGDSSAAIGESVARNLRTRHVEVDDDELGDLWGASRTDGNPWTVTLRFRSRGREQRAAWRFDPSTRSIVAVNPLAADLAYVASTRVRASVSAPPAKRRAGKPAAKRAKASRKPKTSRKPARKTSRKPARKASRKTAAKRKPSRKTASRPKRRAAASRPRRKTAASRPRRKTAATRPKRRAARKVSRRPATKKRTSRARGSSARSRRR